MFDITYVSETDKRHDASRHNTQLLPSQSACPRIALGHLADVYYWLVLLSRTIIASEDVVGQL